MKVNAVRTGCSLAAALTLLLGFAPVSAALAQVPVEVTVPSESRGAAPTPDQIAEPRPARPSSPSLPRTGANLILLAAVGAGFLLLGRVLIRLSKHPQGGNAS